MSAGMADELARLAAMEADLLELDVDAMISKEQAKKRAARSAAAEEREDDGAAPVQPTTGIAAAVASMAGAYTGGSDAAAAAYGVSVGGALVPPPPPRQGKKKRKKGVRRMAGGRAWVDSKLAEWPTDDFRLFVGNLGNEAEDDTLSEAFRRYPSFQRSRVIRDSFTKRSKGYGFVSFADPFDCAKALREMDGKYVGSRPVKLRRSTWKDRNIQNVRRKERKRMRQLKRMFSTEEEKKGGQ
eukprot:PLAT2756.1.p1 GENE.PLAT2756.1~~PLAT2756.1.p1  ORF type:complete len:241 (+),score=109.08 PLAT2756.1:113-835(+)